MELKPITEFVNIQPSLIKKAEYLTIRSDDLVVIANLKELLSSAPLDDDVADAISQFLGVWSDLDAAAQSLIENVPPLNPDYGTEQEKMLNATLIDFKQAWESEK